jgi:hypothetical protein
VIEGVVWLLTLAAIGLAALHPPVGRDSPAIGDRDGSAIRWTDASWLIGLGEASAAGALLWPLALDMPLIAYPLLFIWGGCSSASTWYGHDGHGRQPVPGRRPRLCVCRHVRRLGRRGVRGPECRRQRDGYACHGLPFFAALTCAAFTILALILRRGT